MRVDIVPIAEWPEVTRVMGISHWDGGGRFMKGDQYITAADFDDVFGPPPVGATHVAWVNRWANAHPASLPPRVRPI